MISNLLKLKNVEMYATILLLSIMYWWTSMLRNRRRSTLKTAKIPGPTSLPLVGSTWIHWQWMKSALGRMQFHETVEFWMHKYGSVFKQEVIWNIPIYHLIDKNDMKAVFVSTNSKYPLRPPNEADVMYRKYRKEYYEDVGLVNMNGPDWFHWRKSLTAPLTKKSTVEAYISDMELVVLDLNEILMKRFKNVEKDETKSDKRNTSTNQTCSSIIVDDLGELVYHLGLEMVSVVALGQRLGFVNSKYASGSTPVILESMQGYQKACNDAMYGFPIWKYLPTWISPSFTALIKHKDNLYRHVGSIVDSVNKSRMMLEGGKDMPNDDEFIYDSGKSSILSNLLENTSLSSSVVKSSVIDYITAGVDTIGNTILFTICLIAGNKRVQDELRSEIEVILEGRNQGLLSSKAIGEMTYTRACLRECYRLCPTAPHLARITGSELEVSDGKFVLPKYSVVLCHHRLACLQEENFTFARKFIPERWTPFDEITEVGKANNSRIHKVEDVIKDIISEDMKNPTDVIDLSKRKGWSCENDLVMPYGQGRRICPGQRLAQQEISTVIIKLFQHYEIYLVDKLSGERGQHFDLTFQWLLSPNLDTLRFEMKKR